jgi:hypothetical protein
MNALALLLMTSCPLAADPVSVAGAPCACAQGTTSWVEPARPGLFGRLRGWFHSPAEGFVEGVPVSQPAPVRTVLVPQASGTGITSVGARIPTMAEPPLAPGQAPNLASLGR